jgi:MATE family multidrug resistance protein
MPDRILDKPAPPAGGRESAGGKENVRAFSVTSRSVLNIAVPMTAAYISVPLAGLVDTAVIGQLGVAALIGGIAIGAVILDIVLTSFNFLRAGTTGLTAQAFGAGDAKEQQAVLARALILSFGLGLAVIALQIPVIQTGIWLMNVEAAVSEATRTYMQVRVWAAPFILANFVLLGWLLGLGKARTVLLLATVHGVSNIIFSIWFVLGLGWSVAGVAGASVLAELITTAAAIPFVVGQLPRNVRPSFRRIAERAGYLRLLAVNRDIMVRSLSLVFAFAFFTRQGAQFGDVILAANAILMHFFMIAGYLLDGFATAAEQLAGRAVGARYRPAFDRTVRLTLIWGLTIAVGLAAVYGLFGHVLIDLMTSSEEVRQTAYRYLVWAVLTPIVGVLAFQMDGIYIGATWSRDMRNMMLISLVAYLGVWAIATPLLGNDGLWLALVIFLGMRGFTLQRRMAGNLARTFPG